MTVRWFGGAAAGMAVVNPATGAWLPGDQGTVWTAETGGTQIVATLVDANSAAVTNGVLFADQYGYLPLFGVDTNPVTETVWVDFTGGLGKRVRLECRDRATYRVDAQALTDGLNTKVSTGTLYDANGNLIEHGKTLAQQYATLGSDGKVPAAQLPASLGGGSTDLSAYPQRVEVPSIEDLVLTTTLAWRNSTIVEDLLIMPAASAHSFVLVAPYPLTVLSAQITFSRGQVADATNYWTLRLRSAAAGSTTGTDIATLTTTAGVALYTPQPFSQLDPTASKLGTGQLLLIAATRSTTAAPQLGSAVLTMRYARTTT